MRGMLDTDRRLFDLDPQPGNSLIGFIILVVGDPESSLDVIHAICHMTEAVESSIWKSTSGIWRPGTLRSCPRMSVF